MANEYRPPRKWLPSIAFPLACIGLFSLNCAAELFASRKACGLGWVLIITGVATIILAVFWGKRRN
jgi:hypothetical protein